MTGAAGSEVGNEEHPKLFISYSWSSPEHQEWVLQLARELMESGVEVVIDKWDLREGQDAFAFMERMVSDPTITHVAMVFDRIYAEKADKRGGGVGAEAQILTPEIYGRTDQSKFVALVTERDESGNAYQPKYYSSRIYIDFTNQSRYSESFEQLVRWTFDKPIHKKPALGSRPSFLLEDEKAVSLATSAAFKRAISSLREGRSHAAAAVVEYLELFAAELDKFRISEFLEPYDESFISKIDAFVPFRDEFAQLIMTVARYADNDETRSAVHRFFESIANYMNRPETVGEYRPADLDVFRFMCYELYVTAVAACLKSERFESAGYLCSPFYMGNNSEYGRNAMAPFAMFSPRIETFDVRNSRLKLNRLSLLADTIKARFLTGPVSFNDFMQADFVLYLRSSLEDDRQYWWWPHSLLYATESHKPMEIFARSISAAYFERVKVCLGVSSSSQLVDLVERLGQDRTSLPNWQFNRLSPATLIGTTTLATRP